MSVRVFESMIGKIIHKIENKQNEQLIFYSDDRSFVFKHRQDCCEVVEIEDIVGDLDDLLNSPIIEAEESSSKESDPKEAYKLWTFYRYATAKSCVTVRWIGSTDSCYSLVVSFEEVLYTDDILQRVQFKAI